MLTFSLNPDSVQLSKIICSVGRPCTEVGLGRWSEIFLSAVEGRATSVLNTDRYAYKMHSNEMAKYSNREVPLNDDVAYPGSVILSNSDGFEDDLADLYEAAASIDDFAELIVFQGLIMLGCDLPRIMLKILDYVEKGEKAPTHIIINDDDALICESLDIKVRNSVYTPAYNTFLKSEREHVRAKIKDAQTVLTTYKKYVSSLCEPFRDSNTYANRKAIKEIHAEHAERIADREQRMELLQEELESLKPDKVVSYFDYIHLILYKAGLDAVVREALQNKHLWAGLVYRWSEGALGYDPSLAV